MMLNGTLHGGGAEHVIATLARHLRAAGHHLTIGVIHGGGEVQHELESEGFDIVPRIADGAAALATSSRIRRLVLERNIDVVHTHDLRSLADAGICRLRTPSLSHIHTFHFGNYPFVSRKHLIMESLFSRLPDRLVAVGHAQRDSIVKALRIRPAAISTIWNGVDYAGRAGIQAERGAGDVPVIGSVSTFGAQKGLPTLIQAAHLLHSRGRRFRLVLVGDGQMRAELEAEVTRLGLGGCVEFAGWRPDAAATLLPVFDIFVQSSHWEAMSVVILEAMAARRAIVATTVGENGGVLKHEASALLVPARDAEALAGALGRVIDDAGLRRSLGAAAHAAYAENFTGQAMADRYSVAYRDLIEARKPGIAKSH
jgi:glycosyltransferase involved in cell wall biosynthesis